MPTMHVRTYVDKLNRNILLLGEKSRRNGIKFVGAQCQDVIRANQQRS